MDPVFVWALFACFGSTCSGPESKLIPNLSESQCLSLRDYYYRITAGSIRDFRYARCIGPDGRIWPSSKATKIFNW
jgi:hypothetical protein